MQKTCENRKVCSRDEALEYFGFYEANCESRIEEEDDGTTVFLLNNGFAIGSWKDGIITVF